jgi:hypothetical protein
MNSELFIGAAGNKHKMNSSIRGGFLFIKWTLPSSSRDIYILATFKEMFIRLKLGSIDRMVICDIEGFVFKSMLNITSYFYFQK